MQIMDAMAYNSAKIFFAPFDETEAGVGDMFSVFILAQAECDEFAEKMLVAPIKAQ